MKLPTRIILARRILTKKVTKIPHNINRKIIVTLTTIPSRLKNIEQTIKSIKNQTIDVDEIVLSLPKVSVREPSINDPYNVDEVFLNILKTYNITLLRCDKDYGPATKLLGLLTREPVLRSIHIPNHGVNSR